MSAVAFVQTEKANYPISMLCRVAGISRSRYYQARAEGPCRRAIQDTSLRGKIKHIFDQGRGNYGSPRVHDALIKSDHFLSRKRVIRLMKDMGLRAKTKRKFKVTTDSDHQMATAPERLRRDFSTEAPNKVWVTDITYLRTVAGWMYLAVFIDLYSRRVVGWALRDDMSAALVCDAFDCAKARRRPPPGLIVHSDRGSQYAGNKFKRRLRRVQAIASMSRKADCWDNAVAESFFATLKRELVEDRVFGDRDVTRREVFDYIETFYNRHRKHSFNAGLSPVDFEACQSKSGAA